ncbi:PIN domain-containing protein [Thiococcus pfennigii]|uniref:PIN domain-containing protein n=1 Tax=Thiococcus pfennigii TaxID=1057 RepID=UPI001907127A
MALFDPADGSHTHCKEILAKVTEPLCTTVPVLTGAFHLLTPASIGARRPVDFVAARGLEVRYLDDRTLTRAFALMVRHADHPMDLADASLVVLAETLGLRKVFTIDRGDFATYRIQQGPRQLAFEILS